MNIILLGCPGVGKGSQAALIKGFLNVPHISTGDAFRANIKAGTELGKFAKSFIDKGLLVPDEVTVGIVKDRLAQADCKSGYLLDGFPRTISQAESLAEFAKIDKVINLVIDPKIVIARLSGRRVCKCGVTSHVSVNPKGICHECGDALYIRDDDREETVQKRMEVYEEQTAPLIGFYRSRKVLVDVDATGSIEEVFEKIKKVLSAAKA